MNVQPDMPRQRWWHWFMPTALLRPDLQVLLFSRFLSELGMATLSYGAMVHIARHGATQMQVSIFATAGAIAALVFGLSGGAIADSLSKRVALAGAYFLQALLCLVVPWKLGTSFESLLVLVFSVRLLTQVVAPAVKSAVALVASTAEIGSAVMLLTMAGGVGSGAGSAVLAPLLIKVFEIRVLLAVVGVIMILAAIRTLRLPDEGGVRSSAAESETRHPRLTLLGAGQWLVAHPALASIIVSGAIVAVLNDLFESLQPVFVRDVLDTDPANIVYVFSPGLIGTVLAVVLSPILVRWPGERWLIVFSLVVYAASLVILGLVTRVAPYLAPLSPLNLLSHFDQHFSDLVLAAGLIGIPVKFGAGAANTAVQAYVNKRVRYGEQGSAFGMQTVLQNGFGIVGSLAFGFIASRLGTQPVLICAPIIIVAAALLLFRRGAWGHGGSAPAAGSPDEQPQPSRPAEIPGAS